MSSANSTRVVVTKTVLWTLSGLACAVIVYRFAFGLGSATALSDLNPWGMWIGFDVLSGVALAAGGFVIAATVHIFRLERYHALVRPAILTAFLGYLAVILGLLVDLGRPWNLWRPIFYWQPDSPLFEVAWCVILYTNVLALEFAPVVFEGLRLEKPRRWLRRITIPLVIAGIGLSTLHQSSLGTLFLLSRDRIHPLWDSPVIFLQFLVTAVALGLVMVTTESVASSWLYRRAAEWPLLRGLTRIAAVVLGLYLALRIGDLAWRGSLRYVLEGSWASTLFLVELLMSAVIPIVLFTLPSLREKKGAVAAGAMLGVAGFILHRANVGGIAHIPMTGQAYVPALTELIVSAGVVSAMALVFLFFVERFPVWEKRPAVPDHFTSPMRDPVSRTFFGGPWFSRYHLGALGWVVGAILGVVVLEVTAADFLDPEPQPVRSARSVRVGRSALPSGTGHQLRLLDSHETTGNPGNHVVPALLIDGDRSGTYVLFEHDAHQKRLGGQESCGRCHHRNLALDLGTSCIECHADMYRQTDTYVHARHVQVLGGNRSCERCHDGPAEPKTRAAARPCKECHQADTHESPHVQVTQELPPGIAPGYRAAMHGLCVSCHLEEDRKKGAEEPYLSRCTACHRNVSGEGDEMRLREGWSLSARLVQR